jgi:TetR/AcrR family transcriptional regulator
MSRQRTAQKPSMSGEKPSRTQRLESLRKFNANSRGAIRESNEMRLLQAAETVFAERGFSGATTAEIAARAKLPKANLHYYFRTKAELYRAVLANMLELWLDELDRFTPEREPAEAIAEYVAAKLNWSRTRPNASKVFANEVLHGAPFLKSYLSNDLRRRVEEKAEVIRHWIARGKMRALDPKHFVFQLWAVTQHYADFEVQVRAVLGRSRLTDRDFATAAENITALILHGCLVPSRARPA